MQFDFLVRSIRHWHDLLIRRITSKLISSSPTTHPSSRISLRPGAHLHGHKGFKRFELSTKGNNYFPVSTILETTSTNHDLRRHVSHKHEESSTLKKKKRMEDKNKHDLLPTLSEYIHKGIRFNHFFHERKKHSCRSVTDD